jgi:hypothetical protein
MLNSYNVNSYECREYEIMFMISSCSAIGLIDYVCKRSESKLYLGSYKRNKYQNDDL